MSAATGRGGLRDSLWLRCRAPRPQASVRLVCLPHAGGAASRYLRWSSLLPEDVELWVVQYPGREDRFGESPRLHMHELVGPVADALLGCDQRLALFGHSMGAMVAYEVACWLQERGRPPGLVIASGSRPPSLRQPGDLHTRSDQELLADLRRLNPADEAIGSEELMSLMLPVVRADYQVIETYEPSPRAPLGCPLLVMLGDQDPDVSLAEARVWGSATGSRLQLTVLPGGHFYLEGCRDKTVARIDRALDVLRAPPEPRTKTSQGTRTSTSRSSNAYGF